MAQSAVGSAKVQNESAHADLLIAFVMIIPTKIPHMSTPCQIWLLPTRLMRVTFQHVLTGMSRCKSRRVLIGLRVAAKSFTPSGTKNVLQ